MGSKRFSAIFWNIWVKSQLQKSSSELLRLRINDLIKDHQPDIFGLNEVIVDSQTGQSELLDLLKAHGYQTFFAPFGPEDASHTWGSAIAYRQPAKLAEHNLGANIYTAKRGFPGHKIKLIHAQLDLPTIGNINVVVNYLAHLVPYNLKTHIEHFKSFQSFIANPAMRAATIIGGDFNRFKFMARLLKVRGLYDHATGNFFKPTWRWMGKIPLVQANYDSVLWSRCGQFELTDFRVLDRTPSDHAPLLAKFAVLARR